MKTILHRIYGDYLMPSRLGHYRDLLQKAQAAGYVQQSVRAFLRAPGPAGGAPQPVLVHRHDIDSDLRTARKMFELEVRAGITASYYFRLCTLDFGFMREIEAYGSEASYHYEEVADYAKRHHLKDARQVRQRFPEIRLQFLRNFERIARALAVPMTTVASHGDFANRRLGIVNRELLADAGLRARCGIECETYDARLLDAFDLYISDKPYPRYFHPLAPLAALGSYRRICLLTHPAQWEANWHANTRGNLHRLYEELTW